MGGLRTPILVGALALSALGAFLLATRTGAPHAEDLVDPDAPPAAPPPPVAAPGLASAPKGGSLPIAAPPRTLGATAHVPVQGTVQAPDGLPLAGGFVVAWADGLPAVRTALAADGTFRADLLGSRGDLPAVVRLAVVIPGWAISEAEAPADAAGAGVTLHLAPTERRLSGRVVDPSGAPVSGLGLHLFDAGFLRFGVDLSDRDPALALPHPRRGRLRAITVTDRDGRFEVRGLDAGRFDAVALSRAWIVRERLPLETGEEYATVVVDPAFCVRGEVIDAECGTRVPEASFHVAWGGNAEGFTARDGTFEVLEPFDADPPQSFEVVVSASQAGHEPAEVRTHVDAEHRDHALTLRLRKTTAYTKAGVAFEIVDRDAAFVARPFDLELRATGDGGAANLRVETERVDATHVRATVPAGRWRVRLRPRDGWCNPIAWSGLLDLVDGRETRVRWDVPPHGSARFVVSDADRDLRKLLVVGAADGGETSAVPTAAGPFEISALGVGTWRAELAGTAREFAVRAGEETLVDLAVPPR